MEKTSIKFEKNFQKFGKNFKKISKNLENFEVNDFILLCFKPSLFISKIENNTESYTNKLRKLKSNNP